MVVVFSAGVEPLAVESGLAEVGGKAAECAFGSTLLRETENRLSVDFVGTEGGTGCSSALTSNCS